MGRRGRNNLTAEYFFFVTTTVVRYLNVFKDENACDILIRNIKHYQTIYEFEILAYVIMPSHLHWIVEVNPKKGTISDIMRDIKKYSAWDIMDSIRNNKIKYILEIEADEFPDQKRKLWMPRFDDVVIRNQKMFWSKLEYIHNNPVKDGLVEQAEDYKYSSARNYILDDHSVIKVNTSLAGTNLI